VSLFLLLDERCNVRKESKSKIDVFNKGLRKHAKAEKWAKMLEMMVENPNRLICAEFQLD